MKTKIFFEKLPKDLTAPVKEILPLLPLEEDANGTPVTVKSGDGIRLEKKQGGKIAVTYGAKHEFFRALSLLPDFLKGQDALLTETANFNLLSYMADMSRNAVFNLSGAKEMIRRLALCGYNSLMLYMEDTYEIPEYPYFGYMRGRFTQAELKEIDDYGYQFGIEVIPAIQTLAHLNATFRWQPFSSLRDTDDILRVGDEGVYELIDAMLRSVRKCFRTKRINIGMDEAHNLGRGTYLDRNGLRPKPDIMIEHLNRVVKMCHEHDFTPMMWSDMFFRMQFGTYYIDHGSLSEDVIQKVPEGLELVYWDYYTLNRPRFEHMVECHLQFRNNRTVFAGGNSKWYGFAPLNGFAIESAKLQMDVCTKQGIDIIVTGWGDNGAEASQFGAFPVMLYYAEWGYHKDPDDAWMEKRSLDCLGIGYKEMQKVDLANDVGKEYFTGKYVIAPCKYLLYNDPLNGLMDLNLDPATVADAYRKATKKLKPMINHPEWGYVFETLYRLSDVLINKSDLSVRIRNAYKQGDRDTLSAIAVKEIPLVIRKLDKFLVAFRAQWYRENKSFGFDVQEQRIGGTRQRLLSSAETIRDYLDGKLEKIEELEQEQLLCRPKKDENNPYVGHNPLSVAASACVW